MSSEARTLLALLDVEVDTKIHFDEDTDALNFWRLARCPFCPMVVGPEATREEALDALARHVAAVHDDQTSEVHEDAEQATT